MHYLPVWAAVDAGFSSGASLAGIYVDCVETVSGYDASPAGTIRYFVDSDGGWGYGNCSPVFLMKRALAH